MGLFICLSDQVAAKLCVIMIVFNICDARKMNSDEFFSVPYCKCDLNFINIMIEVVWHYATIASTEIFDDKTRNRATKISI